jgi:CRP/FNR family transcriptional regulator, cyclic AMP receptor protein
LSGKVPLLPQKALDRPNTLRPRKCLIARGTPLHGSSIRQPNLLAKLLAIDPGTRARIIKSRDYPPGELLLQQNDRQKSLYVIRSGTVRAFYTAPSGREITLAYWQAGDLLGADRLYEGGIFRWSCQTIAPTEAYTILETDMRTLVAEVPELAVAIVEALSFKVQWLSSLVQVLGTESVSRRLGHLLDTLCELYGIESDRGIIINAPFTHEDLAAMVGASRQWITMALARFQAGGVLKLGKRRIEVLRREFLTSSSETIVSTP